MILSRVAKKLLHYTGKAIADFNLIRTGDRVLVCLSGGKDSFTLLELLRILKIRSHHKFSLEVLTLNQGQPGWNDQELRNWLENSGLPFTILATDTFKIIKDKIAPGKNYCSFCSRLRRGIIYSYAKKHGFKKIALGHHRDDLIESLLMAIFYNGEIRSQPPKLLTDDQQHVVIRPLSYCQEKDIIKFAAEKKFPVISCGECLPVHSMRAQTKTLIKELAKHNAKIPSNILHALQKVRISQLMDQELWNFRDLD